MMFDMAFLLQNPQEGADGGIAGGVRQGRADFAGGGGTPGMQDVP